MRQPTHSKILKINENDNEITFENLPYGEYAVSVFLDTNGNKKFDMDEYGRPSEP